MVKRPRPTKFPVLEPFRLSQDMSGEIDAWRAEQPDAPDRSEAKRRLIEIALSAWRSRPPGRVG